MSTPTKPSTPLAEALTALQAVASTAGLDPAAARIEGERLAAAVAESAKGAAADWSAQTGRDGIQAFFDAASQGRRWRASPTTLLNQLVLDGSGQAPAYAQALAEVCTAACTLGATDPRVVGNAAVAASSQLSALRPSQAGHTRAAPHQQPTPGAPADPAAADPSDDHRTNPLLAALEQTQQRLAEMARLGLSGLGASSAPRPGSSLDLPPDLNTNPGAFLGLGGPGGTPPPVDPLNPAATTSPEQTQTAEQSSTPPVAPEPEVEPPTLDELLAELDALTGLTEVKAEIHRQVALLRVEALRTKAGLRSPTITRHLVFVGNPGTGKTTVARLVGGIYRALGLLSKGQLVEVDRSELVAGYLGQTAIKTSEVVASAVGGVLFIDEAYSLAGDQYGKEAVDTLVKEMEDHRDDLVLIVAGYPDPMVIFVAQNPGLSSRFRTTIEFADYADDELVDIFTTMAQSADYDVDPDCLTRFRSILTTTPRGPTFGNGRFARNHLEAAIGRHAWRLREVDEPTVEQLRALVADDLDDAAADPEPEPASTDAPVLDPAPTAEDPTPEPDPVSELFADATEAPRMRAPDATAEENRA